MVIGKDAFLKATELPHETVHVPELGGDVILRGMSGKARDEWERSNVRKVRGKSEVDTTNLRAKLLVHCVVDDSDNLVFSPGDAEWLGERRADVIERLFSIAARLSGVTEKDVEELGKPVSTETAGASSSIA